MSKFPERLKKLRKIHKVTQVQLGKKLNFGYTAIANYESGRNEPAIDVLNKIADVFQVSVDYLTGHADEFIAESHLHSEEQELMEKYRSLSGEEQEVIRKLLDVMTKKKS